MSEPCEPRYKEREETHRVVRATRTEALNVRYEPSDTHGGVKISAVEKRLGLEVGDVKLSQREEGGFVIDIRVRRHREEPKPWWGPIAKMTGCWKPLARDWTGHGIGDRLMEQAMKWMREHGAKYVCGEVMKFAVTKQPWLLGWYQRKGFEIRIPPATARPEVHSIIWQAF